jgi:rhomboid protease GluP
MNESDKTGVQPADPRTRDGALDFSSYSLQQLRDLATIIDRGSQPLNYTNLLAELERRTSASSESSRTAGRFSARDGWLGWLDAKRRRSPVFGEGQLQVEEEHVTLHGWQRTWLGVREPGIAQIPLSRLQNVACDGDCLYFESRRRLLPARRIQFRTTTAHEAELVAQRLPRTHTPGFERRWQQMRQFHARVTDLGSSAWCVYVLLLINVAWFLVMAFSSHQWLGFDGSFVVSWGGSFGPAVIEGEAWRLVSAQFLHGDVLHLLTNLWVLFNVGRLACQLYGSAAFLFLYLGSGVCGFVTSIAWNPGAVAVGASGAIFGVFGALFAFMSRQRAQMPAMLLRAHWLSTLVFAGYSLVFGFMQPNIDNAAHVGGLTSGFVLGSLLAAPLSREARARRPALKFAAASLWVIALAAAGFLQVRGIGAQTNSIQKFMRANAWYVDGERANLQKWQQIAGMMSYGAISDAEVSRQFRSTIMPFWQEALQRFSEDPRFKNAEPGSFHDVLLEFVRLRRDWSRAIADATESRDAERVAESVRLMAEAGRNQAKIERLQYRAQMEYRPRALAHSLPVNRIRALFSGWQCMEEPSSTGRKRSPEDSAEDSPAMSYEIGCRAQKLFHERDYQALETLMRRSAATLNDMPDGSSSISAIFDSLSELFFMGGYDLEALLGRTADWRRAVRDPLMAELVEVAIFRGWAWTARGQSYSKEISQQSWALFGHRSQMAAAALESLRATAQDMPEWHVLSIDVALDISKEKEEIRKIYDQGIRKFPTYQRIHSSMMRVLMPRWLGSREEVDQLIASATQRGSEQDLALYASLYWRYFLLEQDSTNIFVEGKASWTNLDIGFGELTKRYPRSDYLLNAHAVMACVALDRERYSEIRPQLDTRKSAAAWSEKYSLDGCDRESLVFELAGPPLLPAGQSN